MKQYLSTIRPSRPLHYLTYIDVLVLAILFFGEPIYSSQLVWLQTLSGKVAVSDVLEFSASDNWSALIGQGRQLLLALLYLFLRRYPFKQLNIRWNWSILPWTVFIFLTTGIVCDLSFSLLSLLPGVPDHYNYLSFLPYYDWSFSTFFSSFVTIDLSTLIYSLFNGFYEELFFLGLLLSTEPSKRGLILLFSTIIRTLFHTYQGLVPALVIGVSFGLFYYYLYTKRQDNLLPYFLAHALADMVGISFLTLFAG